MTATAEETTVLDALDFETAVPCEVRDTSNGWKCPEAADWVITWKNPLPCGAPLDPDFTFMCQGCWEVFEERGTKCIYCRRVFTIGQVFRDKQPVNCRG